MAKQGLVKASLSVTTLNHCLSNKLESRAPTPMKRLAAIRALVDAGIPCGIIVASIFPGLNDHELEGILGRGRDAGAQLASYILIRLPLEVSELFKEWLKTYEPNRANRVMNLLASTRGDKVYQSAFSSRMTGTGEYAF